MLKAVIFDLDGVIVDTEPLHAQVAVRTGELTGIPVTMEDCGNFIGSTANVMWNHIIQKYQSNVPLKTILETDRSVKQERLLKEGYTAVPGVIKLIKDLFEHKVKMAVASSSSQADIDAVLDQLKLRSYFTVIISGSELTHPKPEPDIFLMALKELDVRASDAIVIEDSKNGTVAAKAAGIPVIGFINSNSGNQDLSAASVLTNSMEYINYEYTSDAWRRATGEPVTIAVTNRLVIRELSIPDIRDMYRIYQQPEIKQYLYDTEASLDQQIEKHRAYIQNIYGFYGFGLWGVFEREDLRLIGQCGIEHKVVDGQPEIELSYVLDRNWWGMGYALESIQAVLTYASKILEIDRIVAIIEKGNHRSARTAEHSGFRLEKEINRNGINCNFYSITNIVETVKKLDAGKKAGAFMKKNPDQNVYGKRYFKKEESGHNG